MYTTELVKNYFDNQRPTRLIKGKKLEAKPVPKPILLESSNATTSSSQLTAVSHLPTHEEVMDEISPMTAEKLFKQAKKLISAGEPCKTQVAELLNAIQTFLHNPTYTDFTQLTQDELLNIATHLTYAYSAMGVLAKGNLLPLNENYEWLEKKVFGYLNLISRSPRRPPLSPTRYWLSIAYKACLNISYILEELSAKGIRFVRLQAWKEEVLSRVRCMSEMNWLVDGVPDAQTIINSCFDSYTQKSGAMPALCGAIEEAINGSTVLGPVVETVSLYL